MPDIDPFAREALRRAAQMNRRTKAPEAPKPEPLKEAGAHLGRRRTRRAF